MSRRLGSYVALALLVGALIFAMSRPGGGGASGSSLSRGPGGWLATARVAAANGVAVRLQDRPLEAGRLDPERDLLVMVLPWQRPGTDALSAARAHLRSGGQVLVGYSGRSLAPGEDDLLTGLAVGTVGRERDRLPLGPLAWRRESERPRLFYPTEMVSGGSPLVGPPLARGPVAAGSGRRWHTLFEDESGQPAIVRWRHPLGGTLWLLPSALFSNAWLSEGGNARMLVELVETLPRRWVLDEYHHGLVAADARAQEPGGRALDVMVGMLAVVYLLAVVALGWPWAPPWPRLPLVAGSHREFLIGVGRLHSRLEHQVDGARALIRHLEEQQPGFRFPEAVLRRADVLGPGELVDFAREIGTAQREGAGDGQETRPGISIPGTKGESRR